MKIALFADIHGNITGLRAVLAAIDDAGGADMLFAPGDLLLGGPGTDDVLDLLLDRGVRLVRGNAEEILWDLDQAWLRNVEAGYPEEERATWVRDLGPLVDWTRAHLAPRSWDVIPKLPMCDAVEVSPGRRLFVCHATPLSAWPPIAHPATPLAAMRDTYGAIEADVVAFGHLHFPHVQMLDRKLLVNVGYIAPNPERPGRCVWTLLEFNEERWSLRHVETPYDTAEEDRLRAERGVPTM